jgi:hypothetical protein
MWKNKKEGSVAQARFNVCQYFYGLREELSRKEKSFALKVARQTLAAVEGWCNEKGGENSCEEGCACDGCTEGCVGEGERLSDRKLYLARANDNLACILSMNGKRKHALAAISRSLEIDPENQTYIARRDELKKRS